MEDRKRIWFEGVELGRAKVGSVEDVVARITGADDRRTEGRRGGRMVRVRIIVRISPFCGSLSASRISRIREILLEHHNDKRTG